jgi:hypothetical protein
MGFPAVPTTRPSCRSVGMATHRSHPQPRQTPQPPDRRRHRVNPVPLRARSSGAISLLRPFPDDLGRLEERAGIDADGRRRSNRSAEPVVAVADPAGESDRHRWGIGAAVAGSVRVTPGVPDRLCHRDFVGQSRTPAQRRRRKSDEGRRYARWQWRSLMWRAITGRAWLALRSGCAVRGSPRG